MLATPPPKPLPKCHFANEKKKRKEKKKKRKEKIIYYWKTSTSLQPLVQSTSTSPSIS
jgi:hypothetical protein